MKDNFHVSLLRVRFLNSRLVTLFSKHLNVCVVFKFLPVTAKSLAKTSSMNDNRVKTQLSTITGGREITKIQELKGIEIKFSRIEDDLRLCTLTFFLSALT